MNAQHAPGEGPSFTEAVSPGTGPYAAAPEQDEWPPASRPRERARTPIYVALFVVAALAGSALFVSGFTLGAQQAITPGTSDANQTLFQPFWEAYNTVATEYVGELDHDALVEGAIEGMFSAIGDPFSAYMTSREYKESLDGISGQFEGIGAVMTSREGETEGCAPISASCLLLVQSIIEGSPAEKEGLQAEDQVVSVDGTTVIGSTLEEVVTKVRGPKGTEVTLSIMRDGRARELTIERDVIQTQAVRSEILAAGRVGYLRIDGFSSTAADDFRRHLQELIDGGVSGLVLDLRDDPGGFVDAARKIASQFVGAGPIYWEETAGGSQEPLDALPGGVATDPELELVVLVNGGTASASEIVAGALQDTGRATIVGEQTYGKGTIQQWNLLSGDNGGFRLSVAKWLTPSKRWIHDEGITPDVVVARPPDAPVGDDPQLERAIELLTDGDALGAAALAA
jgi:carboxyl-terminal processing protease